MSRKSGILLAVIFLTMVFVNHTMASDYGRCATMDAFHRNAVTDPDAIERREQLERTIQHWISIQSPNRQESVSALITIPVVVHVIHNTTQQNISNEQIQSQIDRLNKDFRNLNTDKLISTHPFFGVTADAEIEFCLATIDPNGNATTGITRTATSIVQFADNDSMKFTDKGGHSAWDATKYLNIWVCNLAGDLLGYAQLPSDLIFLAATDGVVIDFESFGTMGTAKVPYNLGRTATHEIGHWLNLIHIWGDDDGLANKCSGSDNVADTPNQELPTTGCPSGVVTDVCTASAPGVMYQNYMDYTDDACMVMFTSLQKARMQAVFSSARSAIVTSNKCSGATSIIQNSLDNIRIYPNPAQNYLTIEGLPSTRSQTFTIEFYNVLGHKMYTTSFFATQYMLEMKDLPNGSYMMRIFNDEFSVIHKLSVVN
jgi:hypothetical protein